jgi:acyl-CoA synthetase (AMP-forming)/AMP-acid ligase II
MSLLLEALESPAAQRSTIRFVSGDSGPVRQSELASSASVAGRWLESLAGSGGSVAAVLVSSFDCLSVVFGAWRSGMTLVSLPHPARGMKLDEYLDQIRMMCHIAGASHLLLDPPFVPLMPEFDLPVHGFHEFHEGTTPSKIDGIGRFIQFTSGSTGHPKGIELSLETIESNLGATHEVFEPYEGDVMTSWLPLSHDMGFIGTCLSAYRAMMPPFEVGGHLNLIRPEAFLANPNIWLETCSLSRTTVTAAPGFALRLAGRMLRSQSDRLDLSGIRTLVVGSELIEASGLREFEDAAANHGFNPLSFCPGYGLAESTLAVTLLAPGEHWSSRLVSAEALRDGRWTSGSEADTSEIVDCGRAIPTTEVRVVGDTAVGEIEIRGPSLMDGYVGEPSDGDRDGWFKTSDRGYLEDGSLFVVGRADDVLVIAGENIDPRDLERIVEDHPIVRLGNVVAVSSPGRRYTIVAEPETGDISHSVLREACREIRAQLAERGRFRPDRIVFVTRGTIPKTPSGKLRRMRLASLVDSGELDILFEGP